MIWIQVIIIIKLKSNEGTYPDAGAFLSRDLAHLVDLGELCLP
jgi:hypothetical protein